MTVNSVPGGVPASRESIVRSSPQARWAVALAAVVAAGIPALAANYVVRGTGVADGAWATFVLGCALVAALAISLTAFTLSVTARLRHERGLLLWLPLTVFPALVVFVGIGENVWWT